MVEVFCTERGMSERGIIQNIIFSSIFNLGCNGGSELFRVELTKIRKFVDT